MKSLLEVMKRLRDPDHGCPWDRQQTFASIAPYTIEEAYEVADVIAREAWQELPGELGDLLFQVAFYVQMAHEKDWFEFEDVVDAVVEKMVRRHPHVFADASVSDATEQTIAWEAHKRAERAAAGDHRGRLNAVPRGLAALKRAHKLQRAAAEVGFDWNSADAVLPKLREELGELEAAVSSNPESTAAELGDLVFSCVNLARHLGIDLDAALRDTNLRFESRFGCMEQLAAADATTLEASSPTELEHYWERAKALETGD